MFLMKIATMSKKLDLINEDSMEYCAYWNYKYCMGGFNDGIKLIVMKSQLINHHIFQYKLHIHILIIPYKLHFIRSHLN